MDSLSALRPGIYGGGNNGKYQGVAPTVPYHTDWVDTPEGVPMTSVESPITSAVLSLSSWPVLSPCCCGSGATGTDKHVSV